MSTPVSESAWASAEGSTEKTPTDATLWSSAPAERFTLQQGGSPRAELSLRGSFVQLEALEPSPASAPAAPLALELVATPAVSPLPLPLAFFSPVTSPENGQPPAAPQAQDVGVSAGPAATPRPSSPLGSLDATALAAALGALAPRAPLAALALPEEEEEEEEEEEDECSESEFDAAQETPAAGSSRAVFPHSSTPFASPGPEVIDLSAVTAQQARDVLALLDSDSEEHQLVVPRAAGPRPQRHVICSSSSSDDEAAAPPVPSAAEGASPEALPALRRRRGRRMPCIDSSSDDEDDVAYAENSPPSDYTSAPASPEDDDAGARPPGVGDAPRCVAVDVFSSGTPSPGGSLRGLPAPPQSPAWVLRTPGAQPRATPRKPHRTPGGAAPPLCGVAFQRAKTALVAQLFAELNAAVFRGNLPASLAEGIVWNAKLKTTAGLTYTSRSMGPGGVLAYSARIELSTKVLDDAHKLRQTLCHEMCHAAAWLVDLQNKPPHGQAFKAWAVRAMAALPGLDVTTCHSYDIAFAFRYRCTTDWCGQEYGRHSASIDTAGKACGVCGGKLQLQPRLKADGTPVAKRAPAGFSLYVKEHFADLKAGLPLGTSHGEVMRALAARYKTEHGRSAEEAVEAGTVGMRALDLGV